MRIFGAIFLQEKDNDLVMLSGEFGVQMTVLTKGLPACKKSFTFITKKISARDPLYMSRALRNRLPRYAPARQ